MPDNQPEWPPPDASTQDPPTDHGAQDPTAAGWAQDPPTDYWNPDVFERFMGSPGEGSGPAFLEQPAFLEPPEHVCHVGTIVDTSPVIARAAAPKQIRKTAMRQRGVRAPHPVEATGCFRTANWCMSQ